MCFDHMRPDCLHTSGRATLLCLQLPSQMVGTHGRHHAEKNLRKILLRTFLHQDPSRAVEKLCSPQGAQPTARRKGKSAACFLSQLKRVQHCEARSQGGLDRTAPSLRKNQFQNRICGIRKAGCPAGSAAGCKFEFWDLKKLHHENKAGSNINERPRKLRRHF